MYGLIYRTMKLWNLKQKNMTEKKFFEKKGAGNTNDCKMSGNPANLLPERLPTDAMQTRKIKRETQASQSVVAPPLAQVGQKRSLEPDYANFDYNIELQKLEIREKDLALYKKEQQAKLDFDTKQAEVETKKTDAEAEAYTKKKRADWLYKSYV